MTDDSATETDVLICGAGPVGLTLAMELGVWGVDCLLVERRDGRITVPKMSQVSSRTMELCRRWGIAEKVRGAVWSSSHPLDFVYAASLTGDEVGRFKVPSYAAGKGLPFSPEGTCTCPQIYFDPILAEAARARESVTFRYNTRLADFEIADGGVSARLADELDGREWQVQARYLVGCDGAGGVVRPALGIELDGKGTIATSINIFFRAPTLADLHDKGWARFYRMIDDDGCWAELIAIDGRELWRLTVFDDPDPNADPDAYLRKMAGREFGYDILDVTTWERRDYVAESYGGGPVLIAGDAAHQCSPTGGLGMHTGIAEAVNLSWKLAALTQGWGGPGLLASYDAECRPLARRYVELSTATFDAIAALPGAGPIRDVLVPDSAAIRALAVPETIKARYAYPASPICAADRNGASEDPIVDRLGPGGRAPHVWLADGRSTLDLLGGGFKLLRFGPAATGDERLAAAAGARNMPFDVFDIAEPEAAQAFGCRLALVRPDSHIAWLGDAPPEDAAGLMDLARGA